VAEEFHHTKFTAAKYMTNIPMLPMLRFRRSRLLACYLALLFPAMTCRAQVQPGQLKHTPRMSYNENKFIRLGIDLNLGGAITYLAPATNHQLNLINNHDWGRQVQLSFYSGPVPFLPKGVNCSSTWKQLGWNPIQSGDCYGHTSKTIAHRNTGRSLYVKCVPMHWPLDNFPAEGEFEVWLKLDGPTVQAHCRLTNQRPDKKQYPARSQELPAVYVNGPFYRLMTYTGEKPFTGGALTQIKAQLSSDLDWGHWIGTENWAAHVDDSGWGLGVWNRDVYNFAGGFAGKPGVGGSLDGPTAYIAPNRPEILDHNIVYDYRYELIVGTLVEIRAHVYRKSEASKPRMPSFIFKQNRCGWYYHDAVDDGWPVRGGLDIRPSGPAPEILSPLFFVRAEAAPKLIIEASVHSGCTNATLFWRKLGDKHFKPEQSLIFPVRPDRSNQRLELNLARARHYDGALIQLRLDFFKPAQTNGTVRLHSVRFAK
jgi:hypothetical protein